MQQPASPFGRRDSFEVSGDNTYATIQPRNPTHSLTNNGDSNGSRLRNSGSISTIGNGEIADYATLRNIGPAHPPATVRKAAYFALFQPSFFLQNSTLQMYNIFRHNCTNLLDQHFKRSPNQTTAIMWPRLFDINRIN